MQLWGRRSRANPFVFPVSPTSSSSFYAWERPFLRWRWGRSTSRHFQSIMNIYMPWCVFSLEGSTRDPSTFFPQSRSVNIVGSKLPTAYSAQSTHLSWPLKRARGHELCRSFFSVSLYVSSIQLSAAATPELMFKTPTTFTSREFTMGIYGSSDVPSSLKYVGLVVHSGTISIFFFKF